MDLLINMKYILTVQTIAHVDIRWLLGYATSKLQIYSLICNFYQYCQHCAQHKESTIEDQLTQFDITIYQVSDLDWNTIHHILNQYEDPLSDLYYKYKDEWQLENNLFNNFLFVLLSSSEPEVTEGGVNILKEDDILQIETILDRSLTLLK